MRHYRLRRSCHFCVNWVANSENRNHHLIQRDPIYKIWKFQTQKPNHAPSKDPVLDAYSDTHSYFLSRASISLTRHTLACPPALWCHLPHPVWPRLTRFDLFILTWSEPLEKKKKKKRKKLWPNRTLTLTKKSKFSKMPYSTQFFEYIPILRSVSSWSLGIMQTV